VAESTAPATPHPSSGDSDPAVLRAEIDAALARVAALTAADHELVFGDAVEQVALECRLPVAVALCEQELDGFVPDTVRRRRLHADYEDVIASDAATRAEHAAAEQTARQRSARAAATRAATAAGEAAVASAAIRSATCPRCFTVRSASGVCGCD